MTESHPWAGALARRGWPIASAVGESNRRRDSVYDSCPLTECRMACLCRACLSRCARRRQARHGRQANAECGMRKGTRRVGTGCCIRRRSVPAGRWVRPGSVVGLEPRFRGRQSGELASFGIFFLLRSGGIVRHSREGTVEQSDTCRYAEWRMANGLPVPCLPVALCSTQAGAARQTGEWGMRNAPVTSDDRAFDTGGRSRSSTLPYAVIRQCAVLLRVSRPQRSHEHWLAAPSPVCVPACALHADRRLARTGRQSRY